jgi:hypothetical protein
MPLIPTNYVNNWFKVQDIDLPKNYFLLQSMVSKLNAPATKKELIQGHAGVHVMKTGETAWSTTLSSPVLIINQDPKPNPSQASDIFDLFLLKYSKLYNYFKYVHSRNIPEDGNELYLRTKDLLQTASFTINADGVDMSLVFLNKYTQMFTLVQPDPVEKKVDVKQNQTTQQSTPLKSDPPENDKNEALNYINFVARKAKFYDVKFYIPEDNIEFVVQSGSINVSIDYNKLFFINSNTSNPFYEPKGYSINGSVELIIPADLWPKLLTPTTNDNDQILPGQSLLKLFTKNVNCSIILGDKRHFDIGVVTLTSELSFELQSAGLGLVKVKFETFAANF